MDTFDLKEAHTGGHLTRRELLQQVGGWAAFAAVTPGLLARPRIEVSDHRVGLTGITTGFLELDRLLRGLNAGDLIVLAARPSMGKTALALNMVEHAALSQSAWLRRKPVVLYFSLEMGRQSIVRRILCSRARVDIRREERTSIDALHELTVADELSRTSIYIDDTAGMTMMSLRDRARQQKARTGLDLVVVDYLQLLSFPGSESRQRDICNISRSLKSLARELDVPIVALSQIFRGVELRHPARPELADLRRSGPIEQDADVVLLLYRPEYYSPAGDEREKGIAEVIVAKQRNGPTGSVRLRYFESIMRFENLAQAVTELIA